MSNGTNEDKHGNPLTRGDLVVMDDGTRRPTKGRYRGCASGRGGSTAEMIIRDLDGRDYISHWAWITKKDED